METEVIPCPRLELRWSPVTDSDRHDWKCVYSLVLPLDEHDIRAEVDDGPKLTEMALEIGTTMSRRGGKSPLLSESEIDTPFRDGAHAEWDCKSLGSHIPIVAALGEKWAIFRHQRHGESVNGV